MASKDFDNLLAPVVQGLGLELWGVEFIAGKHSSLLRVYIDAAGRHVTLDDCEAVSHELGAVLDVEDLIGGAFQLEVSSPGIDRPLFKAAHFARFVGQPVKVQLLLPIAGRRRFQGLIEAANADEIRLLADSGVVVLPLAHIQRANLVPDYAALGGQPKPGRAPGSSKSPPKPSAAERKSSP